MHDSDSDADLNVSRRTLLRASAGTAALSAVGSGNAVASDGATETARRFDRDCPEATLEPSMVHCEGASTDGCADDHPATTELRSAVAEAIETEYPAVGALIDAGYKPYFDIFERGDDSWSHWLNPEFIGDDEILNPERPESVLVDNESWRAIGVMFIATRGGESVEPPAVYGDGESEERCSPWHAHAGLPGRFAWWYYQRVYERDLGAGSLEFEFPCRTPCMLHVWTVDHPESVYAHDAPPVEYRDQPPVDDPGFETDGVPGEDELDWDVLPDAVVPEQRPEDVAATAPFDIDLGL